MNKTSSGFEVRQKSKSQQFNQPISGFVNKTTSGFKVRKNNE